MTLYKSIVPVTFADTDGKTYPSDTIFDLTGDLERRVQRSPFLVALQPVIVKGGQDESKSNVGQAAKSAGVAKSAGAGTGTAGTAKAIKQTPKNTVVRKK